MAPPRVSEADVREDLSSGSVAEPLPSGSKVRSGGAEPAGTVWGLKVGAASLPIRTPGLCC